MFKVNNKEIRATPLAPYEVRLSHLFEITSVSSKKTSISKEKRSISIGNLGFRSKNSYK